MDESDCTFVGLTGSTLPVEHVNSLPKLTNDLLSHNFESLSLATFEKEKRKAPASNFKNFALDGESKYIDLCQGSEINTITANTKRELSKVELITLTKNKWLCGGVIDNYLKELVYNREDIVVLSSYFVTSLGKRSFKEVTSANRRTIGKLKVDKLILAPVFLDAHWTLARIDAVKNEIEYYDSLYYDLPQVLSTLGRFMVTLGILSDGYTINKPEGIPRQNNYTDCGVFTTQYARCLIEGKLQMDFDQSEIRYLRGEIGRVLLRSGTEVKDDHARPPVVSEEDTTDYSEIEASDYVFVFDETIVVEMLSEALEQVNLEVQGNSEALRKLDGNAPNYKHLTARMERMMLDSRPEVNNSQSKLQWYKPDPDILRRLQNEVDPFVDLDKNGKPFTRNTAGEWKNCLILDEALDKLAPGDNENKDEGWKRLAIEIGKDVTFVLAWVDKIADKGFRSPKNFVVGSRSKFNRLSKIVEMFHPSIKLKNKHGEGKRVRAGRKHKRFNPY